jgi:uncharacterized protein YdhG (YjbR/CyaY superfamily)
MITTKANSIDEFIAGFPEDVQQKLEQMRKAIAKAAPGAVETIKYGIPTFTLGGRNLVHFAAYKNHIGFYPAPSGIEAFEKELAPYKAGKGTIQFPLDKPLPLKLVTEAVLFRARQLAEKAQPKKKEAAKK